MNYKDLFAGRASVRAFSKDKALEDSELDSILLAASHAPTTGNMQLYSVVVTRDKDAIDRLAALHLGQPAAKGCQAALTFCADTRRFGAWCSARKAKSGLDNLSGDIMAITDACLFAQQFVSLAELEGLGTCYLGTVAYNLDGFCRELDIPEGVIPLFTVVVGYPEGDIPAPSDRLPLEAIVHRGKFHDYTPEAIGGWYVAKEALPESARFIDENGKETLAQVYADVRYPEAQNIKISEDFRRYLKH